MLRELVSQPDIRVMSVAQGFIRHEPPASVEAIKCASDLVRPMWGKFHFGIIHSPVQGNTAARPEPDVITAGVAGH